MQVVKMQSITKSQQIAAGFVSEAGENNLPYGDYPGVAAGSFNSVRPGWSKVQMCALILSLLFFVCLLAGCTESVHEGFSVERLGEGRKGFAIRETSSLDSDSREDFQRAVAMMEEHDYEKAIELFENLIEKEPGVTAPYVNVAMAYVKINELAQAEEHLKAALELVPDHPVASNEYGLLLRRGGRFTEAREIYNKTLKSFPEYLPAHRNLGILCDLYLNDKECALEHYEKYSAAVPGDEQVKIWIADLRMRLGR